MNLSKKNTNNVITVDLFNKLTGQETLHPLVGLVDLSGGPVERGFVQAVQFLRTDLPSG